jgi:arabinose-5-phosphate isomerase
MTTSIATASQTTKQTAILAAARAILHEESSAIDSLARELDGAFEAAVKLIASCSGHIAVTGVGKAGLVGRKISATLASTGSPSYFLHPVEALHGDLGRVRQGDVLLALSHSGETSEVVEVVRHVSRLHVPVLAISGCPNSRLARMASVVLKSGTHPEAGSLRLAPTTSTIAMLALGDALALIVGEQRGFTAEQFARYHPGGSLGLQLAPVEELMRPLELCRVAAVTNTTREVLTQTKRSGRRSGAVLLVDASNRLQGIFTDSDLARLFEQCREAAALDRPIALVMTINPRYVRAGSKFQEALQILREQKISELPVVDEDRHPVGLIDITDVVGWLPVDAEERDGDAGYPASGHAPNRADDSWTIPFPRCGGTSA